MYWGVNFDRKKTPTNPRKNEWDHISGPLNKLLELLDTEGSGSVQCVQSGDSLEPIWVATPSTPLLDVTSRTSGRSCAGRGNGRKFERFFLEPKREWVSVASTTVYFLEALIFWVISKMYLYTNTYIYIYIYVRILFLHTSNIFE